MIQGQGPAPVLILLPLRRAEDGNQDLSPSGKGTEKAVQNILKQGPSDAFRRLLLLGKALLSLIELLNCLLDLLIFLREKLLHLLRPLLLKDRLDRLSHKEKAVL